MKKSELKKLIKEEIAKVLKENEDSLLKQAIELLKEIDPSIFDEASEPQNIEDAAELLYDHYPHSNYILNDKIENLLRLMGKSDWVDEN